MNPESLYNDIARAAIRQGILTPTEADTICRRGHRKQPYWKRHVVDLCETLVARLKGGADGDAGQPD